MIFTCQMVSNFLKHSLYILYSSKKENVFIYIYMYLLNGSEVYKKAKYMNKLGMIFKNQNFLIFQCRFLKIC